MHMHKEAQHSLISSRPGAEGRGRHVVREIEDPAGIRRRVHVHIGESPLSWLRARGILPDRLYRAGDRLREDWEAAGLGARVTMIWDGAPGGAGKRRAAPEGMDPHGRALSAKQRFDGALRHSGPGLSDILWRVVCAGEGLAAAEKALGWPSRAGKLVLGFALERVADFYKIA